MIILDIRLGCFSLLVQRESDPHTIRMATEPGEIILDLPYLRVFLSNYSRVAHQ